MKCVLLAAKDQYRIIAEDGKIPWHAPEDLRMFRLQTLGRYVIMGRKTWESLPEPKLPYRQCIVVTHDPSNVKDQPAHIVTSLMGAYDLASLKSKEELKQEFFIIGGANIYIQALILKLPEELRITTIVRKNRDKSKTDVLYFPINLEQYDYTAKEVRGLKQDTGYVTTYIRKS